MSDNSNKPDPRPFTVEDARGVERVIQAMVPGLSARTDAETVPRDALTRIRRRVRAGRFGVQTARDQMMRPQVVGSVAGSAVLILLLVKQLPEPYGVLVALAAAALAVLLTWRGVRSSAPDLVKDAFLVERRCPACGYDLSTIKPDGADGCSVCPECGGAWRFPRSPCPTCARDLADITPRADGRLWCSRCLRSCAEVDTE